MEMTIPVSFIIPSSEVLIFASLVVWKCYLMFHIHPLTSLEVKLSFKIIDHLGFHFHKVPSHLLCASLLKEII